MSPITLPRMRSVRTEEKEREHSAEAIRHQVKRAVSNGPSPALEEVDARATILRAERLLPALAALLVVSLSSAATRHWLIEAGATLCVAGGFIAAPFLTVTAWIGLALPPRMVLHQASTALFLIAILWMAAALIGAHLHHNRHAARATGRAGDGE